MPTSYSFTENNVIYNFDDVFVPVELFGSGNSWTWGAGSSVPDVQDSPGTSWKQISAASNQASAIQINGSLWSWGNNSFGQLGNNTTNDSPIPVQEFTESLNWEQVSCFSFHTAAIKTDGSLWTCGYNNYGQLGLGDNTDRTILTQVGIETNWKQVNCGLYNTSAIKTDGTLWSWGINNNGQLGLGDNTDRNTPTQVGIETNWKQVSCGEYNAAAIKTDGTLWSWGLNSFGQLGLGDNINRNTPTQVGIETNWKQVSCGYAHAAAVKTDGTLYVWGLNNFTGRLGTNDSGDKYSPTRIDDAVDWKVVDCNTSFAAIKTDGTLWTWGTGVQGQLGNGSIVNNNPIPQQTVRPENDWKQVSAGKDFTAAITYIDPVI